MGYEPQAPMGLLLNENSNVLAEERVEELLKHRMLAETAMNTAMEKQARVYNSKHKLILYKEGDLVLLDPHCQRTSTSQVCVVVTCLMGLVSISAPPNHVPRSACILNLQIVPYRVRYLCSGF